MTDTRSTPPHSQGEPPLALRLAMLAASMETSIHDTNVAAFINGTPPMQTQIQWIREAVAALEPRSAGRELTPLDGAACEAIYDEAYRVAIGEDPGLDHDTYHQTALVHVYAAGQRSVTRSASGPFPLPAGWNITIDCEQKQAIVTHPMVGGYAASNDPKNIASTLLYCLAVALAGNPTDRKAHP